MKHQKAKRLMAWAMLGFVLASAPPAHLVFARHQPLWAHWLLFLSEMALAYPSVLAIWFAEQEE